MATHKRKSTQPWVIARVDTYSKFARSDRFFPNEEEAKKDYEENLDYHKSHGHQIMKSEEYYNYVKQFKEENNV